MSHYTAEESDTKGRRSYHT